MANGRKSDGLTARGEFLGGTKTGKLLASLMFQFSRGRLPVSICVVGDSV